MRLTIDITPRGFVFGLVLVSGLLGASYVAHAIPNGATKSKLSFAGTLRQNGTGLPGQQTLKFDFKKQGAIILCSPTATTTPDTEGAFTTEIDIAGCPNLFDGSDVTFDVHVGMKLLQADVPVSPVPYAKYADAVNPNPDCPVGYVRDPSPAASFLPTTIVCKKGTDEVVKVGTAATSFWIDRYEASIWDSATGGTQKFAMTDDTTVNFPKNGQVVVPLYALSVANKIPAGTVTWFQAEETCAASGKRLPTGAEWLRGARGTSDPGVNDGTAAGNKKCHTSGVNPRNTGSGVGPTAPTSCVSDWGAEDMIGNNLEVTEEWYAGVAGDELGDLPWPDSTYGGDSTANIAGSAYNPSPAAGSPAIAQRGGSRKFGAEAGVFFFNLSNGPSGFDSSFGFRCVIPR